MDRRDKLVFGLLAGFCGVYAAAGLVLHGFALTAFGDLAQFALCGALAALVVWRWKRERDNPPARVFWSLMGIGFLLWTINQGCWVYYEIFLRKAVPDLFIGDVILFFHLVPMMAALAVRPHRRGGIQRRIFAADALLVLLWWVFLYIYSVIPWQYVVSEIPIGAFFFNSLYMAEHVLWSALLVVASLRARGAWRLTYLSFLVPSVLETLASQEINLAIQQGKYYTGSIYDLPFMFAVCLLIGSLWWTGKREHPTEDTSRMESFSVASLVASVATLSLAGFAWFAYRYTSNEIVAQFRLKTTLVAFVVLGAVGIARQRMADRERARLYRESQENYETLQGLQDQLVRSEKMVAIGELVGGAAHQINNPLTAILGYAELLEFGQRDDKVIDYAKKIGQQARRTKDLVQNLLIFARQTEAQKKAVDLNSVVENSIQLRQLDAMTGSSLRMDLEERLPMVWGDPAQLMDVCFHLIRNASEALKETGGGLIVIRTRAQQGVVRLEVIDDGPGMLEPRRVFDPFYTTKGVGQSTGLGLSVCYGIIRDHHGQIHAENVDGGGARFVIQLPVAEPSTATKSPTQAPILE